MKKILLSCMMLLSLGAVNAQAPAEWTEGMDVTAEIMPGDTDGSFSGTWKPNDYDGGEATSMGDYWKGSQPNEYLDVGCYAFYNTDPFDFYQVVKFPAGAYTIKLQANYREGGFADTFANFNKGTLKKNVFLYASVLAGEAADSEVIRDFNTVIASLAETTQPSALYTGSLGWSDDASAKVKDAEGNEITVYAPSCNKGCRAFFDAGYYSNSLNIVLVEDAWVRVGIRKKVKVVEDNLSFRVWNIIYNGPADEEAQLDAAAADCYAANAKIEELRDKVSAAGFEGFAGIIDDVAVGFNDAISEAKTAQEFDAVLASINAAYENYNKSIVFVNSLSELVDMTADMIASTDFPGKAAIQTAYDEVSAAAKTDDPDDLGDDAGAYFDQLYVKLAAARADYLNTQEADETGAKDFSSLIKHPWFVNPEYTPQLQEEGAQYFGKNVGGKYVLNEETWTLEGPNDYTNRVSNGCTPIASEVELASDSEVLNQWYKRFKTFGDGWSANSYHLYYLGGLICVSTGWNSGFEDWEGVCQQLVGLPNGYYSLKGLVRGNGTGAGKVWNDDNLPPYHNIFAQNSEEVVVRSVVGHTDGYYCQQILGSNNGWYEWDPQIWQEHKTGTIQVSDGKLLIGGQSSMTGAFTGFRLMFYGTNPPFDAMIQEEIDKVNKDAEALTFAGDKKAVADMMAAIKLPLVDAAAYDAALTVLVDVRDYIGKVNKAMNGYKAEETYENLGTTYAEDADASEIIATALTYVIGIGEKESDTYVLVDPANAAANKLSEYLALYTKAKAFGDANVNAVLAEQVAELKAAYKEADAIQEYMDALALPYNVALFASLGAADASEAAPLNLTSLLVNPTFENENGENDPTTGWSGETPTVNEYGRGNAELWNKAAFTLSQKLAGLPAGKYELRVKAIYRDAASVTPELVEAYKTAGSEEAWANHNAELFMKSSDDNDAFSYIKAIESIGGAENSFTEVVTAYDTEDLGDGTVNKFPTKIQTLAPEGSGTEPTAEYSYLAEGAYPFDTKLTIGEEVLYYPASMYGFYQWCVKNPDAVANKVQIEIAKGETLEVGIRKTNAIGSDWVIFDDFELYYLSGDKFQETVTDIDEVASEADADAPIYNVAGQIVDKSYKGIVIQNGVKSINK
ncbi:MAG: hypothetical protein Q4F47_03910 [Bacteroidaceae bacterium]|nr:hypothetical protein [Bacteroidaceae bacterium]